MRILYAAIDQTVPGTTGGSVHVTAVAEGLAALGHEVHVLVTPGDGPFPSAPASNPVRWIPMAPPLGRQAAAVDAHRRGPAPRGHAAAGGRDGALLQLRRRRHAGGVRGRRQDRARGQRAGHRSCGLDQGAARPRAHRRADAPMARAPLRARRPHRHAERRDPSAGHAGAQDRAPRVGRRHGPVPARTHLARRRSRGRGRPSRSLPGRSGAGTAPSTSCARCASLQARGRSDIGAVLVGDGPELPAVQDAAAGLAERRRHRRRAARGHAGVPGRRRHRRRAVRDRRAPSAVARLLLVAAQDLRVHGRRPSGRRAGGRSDPVARRRRPRRARCTTRRSPTRWRRRSRRWPTRRSAGPLGRAARERAVREYSWQAHCVALDNAIRKLRRAHPDRRPADHECSDSARLGEPSIRCASCSPPTRFRLSAAGSGWSTYELARGLRARGHDVIVVQPKPGTPAGRREREYDGIRVLEFGFPAPALPYVRNYFKNERLYPALADALSAVIAEERVDLVHGQHVLTCLPAIAAAHRHHAARRLHGPRLLAGLLLVGSDLHAPAARRSARNARRA